MVCYRPNMEHAIQISNRTQSIHAMNGSVLCCNYQINAVRKSFLFLQDLQLILIIFSRVGETNLFKI